jgi:hypothetical protein
MAAKKKAAKKKKVDVVAKKRRPSKKKLRVVKKTRRAAAEKKTYKPRNGAFVVVKGTKGIAGILDSVVGHLANVIVGGSPEIEIVPLKSVRRATKDEERIVRFFMDRAGEAQVKLTLAEAQPERDEDNEIATENLKKAEAALGGDDLSLMYAAFAKRPESQQVTERAEDVVAN